MMKNNDFGIRMCFRACAESRYFQQHSDSTRQNSGQCPVRTKSYPKTLCFRRIAGTPTPCSFRVGISSVGACHDPFPRLFGRKGVSFQILHRKPLFAVTEIGIYDRELVCFEFEHRNGGVPIARGSLFVAFRISIPCGFACVKLR